MIYILFSRTFSIEERLHSISLVDENDGHFSMNSASPQTRSAQALYPNHTTIGEIAVRRATQADADENIHLSDLAVQTTWKQTVLQSTNQSTSATPPPKDSEPIYAQVNLREKYARRAKRHKQTPQSAIYICDETDGYSIVEPREMIDELYTCRERPKSINVGGSDYEEVNC